MVYFDTDLWIHSFIHQDRQKHEQSKQIIKQSSQSGYVISILNIQEILFVLAKLKTATN